jgi:hypothetical protein
MKKKLFDGLATALLIFGMVGLANASLLTFEGLSGYNYVDINQNYGDNITSTSDAYGQYLEGNGFTPHISVSYNTAGGNVWLEAWDYNYGDLVHVAYADVNGGIAEIKFTADPGYKVTINSFDMAAYPKIDNNLTILEIVNGEGVKIWDAPSLFVEGSDGHSYFSPAVSGSVLTVRWGTSWNIGIDNINFDESAAPVPVPPSIWLLGSSLFGLIGIRRKFR